MVDPSTNATDPTYPALHTLYANVTVLNNNLNWTVLAPYLNPEPNTVAPHDYTLLLFKQPKAQLVIPSEYSSFLPLNTSNLFTRVAFPLLNFIQDTGLGQPVAGNYFLEGLTITNTTSSSAVPYPTSTGIVRNSTATATATGTGVPTGTGSFTTTARSTSTATSTSPPVTGQAFVSGANLGSVFLGLGAVVGALMI